MAPKINFSHDEILQTAFNLVKSGGLSALTARNIADALHCTARPIYRAFGSMQGLEEAVLHKALEYAVYYVLHDGDPHKPFLSLGLRYLQFAKEEPELFTLVFMSKKVMINFDSLEYPFNLLVERAAQNQGLCDLPFHLVKGIFKDMWIFVHGLTTLVCVESLRPDEDELYEYIEQMGITMMSRSLPEKIEINME